MLGESGVTLFENHRLRERTGVRKEGFRIAEILTENGARLPARVFADASYEGDLVAQAKVSYPSRPFGDRRDKQAMLARPRPDASLPLATR